MTFQPPTKPGSKNTPAGRSNFHTAQLNHSALSAAISDFGLRISLLLALVTLGAPLSSLAATKNPNSDCFDCHNDKTLYKTNAAGKGISLFVDEAKFAAGVHGTNTCKSCHADITPQHPDAGPLKPVDCARCHQSEGKAYATSIHGVSHQMGPSAAATCVDCHGNHGIVPVKQADSPVYKLNLPATCASCHSNPRLTKQYQIKQPEAVSHYVDSIHGRALLKLGLIVAPSCNDCHGVHDIKRPVDQNSPINRDNVAATCGKCHVKVEAIYSQSVHGQLVAKEKAGQTLSRTGDHGEPPPVCIDCHTSHQVEAPDNNHFKKLAGDQILRPLSRRPSRALSRDLSRQSHGARPGQQRPRSRRLL